MALNPQNPSAQVLSRDDHAKDSGRKAKSEERFLAGGWKLIAERY
jgi:hypothetical protein